MHRPLLLLPLLLLPACLSEPKHLPRVELPAGVSSILEGVPGTIPGEVPAYLRSDLDGDGLTFHLVNGTRWIEVRSTTDVSFPFVAAHEYAHASLGPDWRPLPMIVEEALCTRLARRFAPEETVAPHLENLLFAVRVSSYSASYDLDWSHVPNRTWYTDPTPDHMIALGIAHALANGIPIETLHELCLRATAEGHAQVPDEWFLARAAPAGSRKTGPDRLEEIVQHWLAGQSAPE